MKQLYLSCLFALLSIAISNAQELKDSFEVYFEFNKAVLKPNSKATIDSFLEVSKTRRLKVRVAGYTCDIGTDNYNMGLSEKRAISAFEYLKTTGEPEDKIELFFYGEKELKYGTGGKAENRRVFILFALEDDDRDTLLRSGCMEVFVEKGTFKPNKNKSLRLTMDQVSSSIRSILSLYFYIRDQGHQENQMLMIDEPEMNLHPKNQRAMARFLASLVNQGIKVMVSTHSDYLVRELSHLTALHQYKEKESIKAYLADEKNPYSEEVLISPDQVGLCYTAEDLVLKKGNKTKRSKGIVLRRVEPNAYGAFDVDSFDKTIIEQNETGTDIVNLVTPFVEEEQ
jgi:hypothetical protein